MIQEFHTGFFDSGGWENDLCNFSRGKGGEEGRAESFGTSQTKLLLTSHQHIHKVVIFLLLQPHNTIRMFPVVHVKLHVQIKHTLCVMMTHLSWRG